MREFLSKDELSFTCFLANSWHRNRLDKAISESRRASSKANDAKRKFSYAKREKDIEKKLNHLSEGLDSLADAVSHSSNSIEPLAEVSFVASLLVESIQNNLDKQTDDIVSKLRG